jgi:cephalosporin hydroxylase
VINPHEAFQQEVAERIADNATNHSLQHCAAAFLQAATAPKYCYNFSWLGRPIIQYPTDMVAMQELIWRIQPDLIIETGIAHGGSLILSASLLALLDYCHAATAQCSIDPAHSERRVIGIDVDIRAHNRAAIEAHPLASRITMLEGSSVAPHIIEEVYSLSQNAKKIMVFLDSLHTHDHVLAELQAYTPLVTMNSYCVVFDTIIEDLPPQSYPDRPWDVGNNPKTAVHAFLNNQDEFVIDDTFQHQLLITVAPDGFLKRVR